MHLLTIVVDLPLKILRNVFEKGVLDFRPTQLLVEIATSG